MKARIVYLGSCDRIESQGHVKGKEYRVMKGMWYERAVVTVRASVCLCVAAMLLLLTACTHEKAEPIKESVETKTPVKADSHKAAQVKRQIDTILNVKVPPMGGRCIAVSLCGVDSRLSDGIKHADANHVIKFWLDSGAVEIVDVPRDTRVEVGLDSNLNILTNLRAHRGRRAYLDSIAKITRTRKIDYYCELGFSQALGMLELLGHKEDATQTLRVLRSRQGFDAGDFQRCYNQGNFLAQVLSRHFDKATGWFRDPLLRAALLLVDSNMPVDTIKYIIDELQKNGFPQNKKCYVHIMPNFGYRLPRYDFESSESIKNLNTQIDAKLKSTGVKIGAPTPAEYKAQMDGLLARAAADTAKNPRRTVQLLSLPYQQRSWMQLSDKAQRADAVKRLCTMLIVANNKIGKKDEALKVTAFYEQHREAFEQ